MRSSGVRDVLSESWKSPKRAETCKADIAKRSSALIKVEKVQQGQFDTTAGSRQGAKILMKEPPLAREAVSGENLLDRKVH
jgi:hypothetical protein